MSDETDYLKQVSETLIAPGNKRWLINLIESLQAKTKLQAERIEELDEKNEQLEHNKSFYVRQYLKALLCEDCKETRQARLQASIAESVKDMSQQELDEIIADLEKPLSGDELLLDEEIENRKLKQENATLRATAELVGTALRDYVRAQSKIDDRWEVSDATVQHQLLRDLHFCEALGREALEALKANAAQPTNKPTDSDGSST